MYLFDFFDSCSKHPRDTEIPVSLKLYLLLPKSRLKTEEGTTGTTWKEQEK